MSDIGESFNQLVAQMSSDADLYNEIGLVIQRSVQKNFDSEGRYGAMIDNLWEGGKGTWKPLSSSRIKQRKKKGLWPGKILQDTGGLKSSVSYEVTKQGVIIGAGKKYAEWLQYGTEHMEARPFIVIQDEDVVEIEKILQNYLKLD